MITLEQAKALTDGNMLHHVTFKNADNTPARFKVNGGVKRWKREPDRIRVPLKHGLYGYGYLTNGTFEGGGFTFHLDEVNLGSGY